MRRESMSLKGSFTVEAAFVIPLCIYIVVIMIYMSLYLADRITIGSVNDLICNEVSNELHKRSVDKEKLEEYLKKSLVVFRYDSCAIEKEGELVKVRVYATPRIPFATIAMLIGKKQFVFESQLEIYDPTRMLRLGTITYDSWESFIGQSGW